MTGLPENGRYTPALGQRLHTLAASLSQTLAWHAFDRGRHAHASQNWIAGLHNARAAGDHNMGAGLLSDLAYQTTGQALLVLGDTARAHRLITEGEQLLPAARPKTRGVFLTYRAANYLDLKEPEPAAAAATESLLLARRFGAPRCVSLVEDLLPRFQPYARAQGVAELLQLAAA